MSNNALTEYRMELGITLLILFGLASLIGILGAVTNFNPTGMWSTFHDIVAPFGNWVYWLAFIGPIGLIFSLWWVLDFFLKIRKLKDMINTESKSKFIKNQDDIEYIAWRLPKKYKILVARKKTELRIS
jgi:H+/Cl- antiporter ClcA